MKGVFDISTDRGTKHGLLWPVSITKATPKSGCAIVYCEAVNHFIGTDCGCITVKEVAE